MFFCCFYSVDLTLVFSSNLLQGEVRVGHDGFKNRNHSESILCLFLRASLVEVDFIF
jgi:hypothetical protein